jgi:hypothetical protein
VGALAVDHDLEALRPLGELSPRGPHRPGAPLEADHGPVADVDGVVPDAAAQGS